MLAVEPACPECGCLPPEVIAARKRARHLPPTMVWFCAMLTIGAYLSWLNVPAFNYATTGLMLGVIGVGVWVSHLLVAITDPNRSRAKSVARSKRLERIGLVELVSDPDPDLADRVPRATSGWTSVLLLVGAAGVMLQFAPFALKAVSRWPENSQTKPEVAGPGDTVRVWLPHHVQAVKGHWNGRGQAVLLVEGEIEPIRVPATGAQEEWGNSITGKTVRNEQTQLWADVRLPDDPALVGKRVEVQVDMAYQYPTEFGGKFVNVSDAANGTQLLTLADQGAGGRYKFTYVAALTGGGVLILCGVGLSYVAHRQVIAARRR